MFWTARLTRKKGHRAIAIRMGCWGQAWGFVVFFQDAAIQNLV